MSVNGKCCCCCCFLFLKIGFCWFERASCLVPENMESVRKRQTSISNIQTNNRTTECPPTGNWQLATEVEFCLLSVCQLQTFIAIYFCFRLAAVIRFHVDTLWGRFIVGVCILAITPLTYTTVSGPDPDSDSDSAPVDAIGHFCVRMSVFYVQVFNIVFDEVISICCLMNCNRWLGHQITIALLEFHWCLSNAAFGIWSWGYQHHLSVVVWLLLSKSKFLDVVFDVDINMQSLSDNT